MDGIKELQKSLKKAQADFKRARESYSIPPVYSLRSLGWALWPGSSA